MLGPFLFCIVTKLTEQHLKHEAGERLEKSLLKNVILSQDQFRWTETGKEISINGELFDVKCYSCENGRFVFTGLFDKEETALTKLEQDWNNHKQDNNLLSEVFQVLQSVFHNSRSEEGIIKALTTRYPYLILNKLPFTARNVITPPPQG